MPAIEVICSEILDSSAMSALAQCGIDGEMLELNGTEKKAKLRANAILGVSLAVAKAAVLASELRVYKYLSGHRTTDLLVSMTNIFNGGAHADNNVDLQEFMIMTVGTKTFPNLTRTPSYQGTLTSSGDDLFDANVERLSRGIDKNVTNSIQIKVNQIGTLSETLKMIETGRRAGYTSVIADRSGATENTTIADLAVAIGAGQIMTGAQSMTGWGAKCNKFRGTEENLGVY